MRAISALIMASPSESAAVLNRATCPRRRCCLAGGVAHYRFGVLKVEPNWHRSVPGRPRRWTSTGRVRLLQPLPGGTEVAIDGSIGDE